jgi:hypothetical protein
MKWHKDYAAINPHSGRVLFIDFAQKGLTYLPILLARRKLLTEAM